MVSDVGWCGNMVTGVRYVHDVRWSLVSLGNLDSCGCEIRIYSGSIDVLWNDKIVIRGTKHGGLYEMVNMVETASTIVLTSTYVNNMRIENPNQVEHLDAFVVEVGVASGAVFVEIVFKLTSSHGMVALCQAMVDGAAGGNDVDHCIGTVVVGMGCMTGDVIGERLSSTQGGDGWLGCWDPCGRLDAGGGGRGPVAHVACGVMWGVALGLP